MQQIFSNVMYIFWKFFNWKCSVWHEKLGKNSFTVNIPQHHSASFIIAFTSFLYLPPFLTSLSLLYLGVCVSVSVSVSTPNSRSGGYNPQVRQDGISADSVDPDT